LSRKTGDIELRACVIHFARVTQGLFGKHLVGSVETVTKLALGRDEVPEVAAIIQNHFSLPG
jgi:hypothetical protein